MIVEAFDLERITCHKLPRGLEFRTRSTPQRPSPWASARSRRTWRALALATARQS
jgi:hypothetical protein